MSDRPTCMRFGPFELWRIERKLFADGRPAILGARAFDLLLALIEHRDRVVTKNELLQSVWPGQVVEEANLNVQVSGLRKVLGPEAIATIPGRGYRFALQLDESCGTTADSAPAARLLSPVNAIGDLPRLPGAVLGRADDLVALERLMAQHRLVTLLGSGGIGKTTLALAAAHARERHHRDGVLWLELAQVSSAELLPSALATALNIPPGAGDDPLRPLIAALKPLQMLLVLDNAEHLSDAVARLAQAVLCGTDGVRVLVTSQASLRLPHGHVYRLGPLQTPPSTPPADQALAYGAIALFAERARCLDRSFAVTDANVATIADICRSLDGVALAIELATARLPLLGLQGLRQRLGDRFRLLTGGAAHAPSRQQTLRAALDWSHALLAPQEQAVFRALGVFVGGFTLELASAVARHDGLDEWTVIDIVDVLVDHSLVAVDTGGEPRYRLLESAREYALLCLDAAGEREQAQRRHSQAMLQWAERAAEALWTMPEAQWLARHAPDIDNIRAALEWSSVHALPLAVGLAGSSSPLFFAMSLLHESRRRCDPLHERLESADVPQRALARFFRARSEQLRDASIVLQHEFAMRAVQLYRELGDDRGLYLALYEVTAGFQVYDRAAAEAASEMVRLERPEWPAALRALRWIGESKARYAQGQMPQNRAALEAALPLVQSAGTDRLTSVVLCNLADHALYVGAVDEAVQRGRQLSELLRRGKRNFHLAFSLANLAAALLQQGDAADARKRLAEAIHLMRTLEWSWLGAFGDVYALLAAREGRIEAAARLIGWADKTSSARGERQPNEARCRALAEAEVLQRLGASQVALLMAEGAGLDEESVAELTLAMPQVRSEA